MYYNENEIRYTRNKMVCTSLTDSQLSPCRISLILLMKKVCFQQGLELVKGMGVMNM